MTNRRRRPRVNNFLSEQSPDASLNVHIPTYNYSVEVEPFEFSFIPTTNMLPRAGCPGFAVKLHQKVRYDY